MYLLETFHAPGFKRIKQSAFKKGVCFFATLSIYGIVAICKPVEEITGSVVGVMSCEKDYVFAIEHICDSLFAVRSLEFEPVSGTHEFNPVLFELSFEPAPVFDFLLIFFSLYSSRLERRTVSRPSVVILGVGAACWDLILTLSSSKPWPYTPLTLA